MATKTISLDFSGYWRKTNISGIPQKSGIYVVYECSYDQYNKTVDLKKIIYIGEAANVNGRIADHELWDEWEKHCGLGNQICFSLATVSNPDRERGEAALIYKYKPPVNTEYKYNFPFDQTTMNLSGKTALLNTDFTVYKSE